MEGHGGEVEMKRGWIRQSLPLCVGLTNFHLHKHPLRAEDSKVLKTMKNRRYHTPTTHIQKRRQVQRRYGEKIVAELKRSSDPFTTQTNPTNTRRVV